MNLPLIADCDWTATEPGWLDGHTVWLVDLAVCDKDVGLCARLLSPEEKARASRFRYPRDASQFLVSHAALRMVLGASLSTNPATLTFRVGPAGKPDLDGAQAGRLHFNLSHSGRYALIGVSTLAPLGVDVEVVRPLEDIVRIARTHFHPIESAALEALPPLARRATFFACWTRKEAVLKALGAGLSLPLNRFAVSLPPAPPALLHWEGRPRPYEAWSLHHLAVGPNAVGAVAIAGPTQPCRRLRLAPGWIAQASESA